MAARFHPINRDAPMLLPPDMRDWIGEDDLVHFVIKAVERLSIENFKLKSSEHVHVCRHNAPDKTENPIPSVWVVKDPKTRIVCITLGHDDKAHTNPSFKTLLTNAVKWVGKK